MLVWINSTIPPILSVEFWDPYVYNQSWSSAQGQVFHCKLCILHSAVFLALLFISPYSPFIIMLCIIWFLLPRTFFLFTIPSRASFSRQFLSQWPSQYLFLLFIRSSIILPSSTPSSTTAFFILSLHFTRYILLHIHITNASSRVCLFRLSVQVSAPYNATLYIKHFTSLFLSSFCKGPQKIYSLPVKSFFCHCYPLLYFYNGIKTRPSINIVMYRAFCGGKIWIWEILKPSRVNKEDVEWRGGQEGSAVLKFKLKLEELEASSLLVLITILIFIFSVIQITPHDIQNVPQNFVFSKFKRYSGIVSCVSNYPH